MKKIFLSLIIASSVWVGCKKEIETKVIKAKESTTITKANTELNFTINGMTCAMGCAATIEEKLAKTNGVTLAEVNFDKKQAKVAFDNTIIKKETLLKIVTETGDGATYTVSQIKEHKM